MNENEKLRYIRLGIPGDIMNTFRSGRTEKAVSMIDSRLSGELSDDERACLEAYRKIIKRTPGEYPLSFDDVYKEIRKAVPGFKKKKLKELILSGAVHTHAADGKMRYFSRAVPSLLKGMPALAGKASYAPSPRDTAVRLMKENGEMSQRITVRASIALSDRAFRKGMELHAYLPVPRACPEQSGITFSSVLPQGGLISPEDSLTRTIYWEERMEKNHPFTVEYSYTRTQRYNNAYEAEGTGEKPDTGLRAYLREEYPQIVFTPLLKSVTSSLIKGTKDPLERARRIYDYITLGMTYSYMPAYFVLTDIVDDCLRSRKGDCGVFALTMITMLRYAGIPARWQSGLAAGPDSIGCHDWVRFYCAPFGWLYADPSYGTGAVRDGNEERRRFYFGNIDPWRMSANDTFMGAFSPEKRFFSSDPYDNQTGEIESGSRGFYGKDVKTRQELIGCTDI